MNVNTTKEQDEHRSQLEFLYNRNHIQKFLDYYYRRQSHSFIPASQAIDYMSLDEVKSEEDMILLIDRMTSLDYVFPIPQKIIINKMASQKSRTVYVYPEEEQFYLKYLNFCMNELKLDIHEKCYSFQKNKSILNAVKRLTSQDLTSYVCIKMDISNYFNSIPMNKFDDWLAESVLRTSVIYHQLKEILTQPYVNVNGVIREERQRGVMAGMPISPTLSNLYLKDFDVLMANTFIEYARYSDDMIFFCELDQLEASVKFIRGEIEKLKLVINEDKTSVFLPGEGFEFLGVHIKGSQIDLSKGTMLKIKSKIKRATKSLYRWQVKNNVPYEKTAMVMIRKFNRKFYGYNADETEFTWARWFFSIITVDHQLKMIDQYFQESIRYLATGKYSKKNYHYLPYDVLKKNGYIPLVSAYYKKVKSEI